jgi:hypothetical protein
VTVVSNLRRATSIIDFMFRDLAVNPGTYGPGPRRPDEIDAEVQGACEQNLFG